MSILIRTKIKSFLIVSCIFIILCYFINYNNDILGLFIDDLKIFEYYPKCNIFEYSFKFYSDTTKYRPVYYFFQYIMFFIAGHNPHILFIINIIFNSIIASCIYSFCIELHKNRIMSFLTGALYLISHLICYQINQVTGLMESIATFLSIIILIYCIEFINLSTIKKFVFLLILYLLISFTHERYIVLIVLIGFATLFCNIKLRFKFLIILCELLIVLAVFYIRYLATNSIIPSGTSGTKVIETFNIEDTISNIIIIFKGILGISVGDEASFGLLYNQLSYKYRIIVIVQIVMLILFFVGIIIFLIKYLIYNSKFTFKLIYESLKVDIIYISLILITIIASSVTIMVEKRFLLVPYVILLLYINYLFSKINKIENDYNNIHSILIRSILLIICVTRIGIDYKYNIGNKNIYFMIDQRRLNSLAKETVYKYGNDIVDTKTIFILNNTYLYTKYYSDNFFQIYQKDYKNNSIKFINNISDIKGKDTSKIIILKENRKFDTYYEINGGEHEK